MPTRQKRECARQKPSALDIFLDLAIAMADPPMTHPAESPMYGSRQKITDKIKEPDRFRRFSLCLIQLIISFE